MSVCYTSGDVVASAAPCEVRWTRDDSNRIYTVRWNRKKPPLRTVWNRSTFPSRWPLYYRQRYQCAKSIVCCRDGGKWQTSFAKAVPLDLNKGGIPSLSYIPDLGGYLLVSGKTVSGQEEFDCDLTTTRSIAKFLLWFWDGKGRCMQVSCFYMEQDGVKIQPEGISPATVDAQQTICIVSDDGDEDNQIPGRYSLLSETQYQELEDLVS